MPIQGDTRLTFALERPGASADQGEYADRIELSNVKPRFRLPDFSAEYRYGQKWGYVELAGILRSIAWEDMNNNPTYDLSGQQSWLGIKPDYKYQHSNSYHIQGTICLWSRGLKTI